MQEIKIDQGGNKYYYWNDKLHREDGPAIEFVNGDKEWFFHGKYHRVDGPAIELASGHKEWWYFHGKLHRTNGPAIDHEGKFFLHGKEYTEEEYGKLGNNMSKEFLNNLYYQCLNLKEGGADQAYFFISKLLEQKNFSAINSLFSDLDLSLVDTGTMYMMINLTAPYRSKISTYQNFYLKIREEYARRGRSSQDISKLLDHFQEVKESSETPYVSKEESGFNQLNFLIEKAELSNDKELVFWLQLCKSQKLAHANKEDKFRNLVQTLGHDELRKRTIDSLRHMANLLEKTTGCWPGIYYAELPKDLNSDMLAKLEVILSYPWPG
jgi:hypothetical protein